jgi:IS30 family transposase
MVARRRFQRVPEGKRSKIIGLAARGLSMREIGRRTKVGLTSVRRIVNAYGGVFDRRDDLEVAGRLSLDDRVEIQTGLRAGETQSSIAIRLGCHRSTVCREVKRCPPDRYRAVDAHRHAVAARRRPKPCKLGANPTLLAAVTDGLAALWSPEQISSTLAELHPGDPSMNISHETIYKSIYVQARGELRREVAACLRTGRAVRKAQNRATGQGKIPGMVMISDRPAAVEDRAVPGHWEGDLIIGRNGRSAVGTLVERTTRFVILLHLPDGRTADKVADAMIDALQHLPDHLRRSVTWDQGKEMAQHDKIRVEADIDVYFCEPHSPWQRPTNENTNGLLRQYMPKSTDLSKHTRADLDRFADSLNSRPRKTLKWATPAHAFASLVATTP